MILNMLSSGKETTGVLKERSKPGTDDGTPTFALVGKKDVTSYHCRNVPFLLG